MEEEQKDYKLVKKIDVEEKTGSKQIVQNQPIKEHQVQSEQPKTEVLHPINEARRTQVEGKNNFAVELLREIKRGVRHGKHPDGIMTIPWNRQTRKFFDKGRKPKQGRRYVFVCRRFDGTTATFTMEQL